MNAVRSFARHGGVLGSRPEPGRDRGGLGLQRSGLREPEVRLADSVRPSATANAVSKAATGTLI